jgi:chemosensory pili system protein ChpB (putative protein-glutamate methylesterase)
MAERSAAAGAQRVALLARPGKAADNLADALRQAGADLVLVADPNTLDESALLAAQPQAVLVALEPGIEQAIDRLDAVLSSPALTVIFDEADLAAHRAGWDAARWVRHLSAKLNHHQQVLPPGGEAETEEWYPSPGQLPKPTSAFSDLDLGAFAEEAAVNAGSVPMDGMNLESMSFDTARVESAGFVSAGFVSAVPGGAALSDATRDTAAQETIKSDDTGFDTIDFDAFEQMQAGTQDVVEPAPAADSFETSDLVLAPMNDTFDDLSMTKISFDDFAFEAGSKQESRFDAAPETTADFQTLQIDELADLEAQPQNIQPMQFDDDAFFLEELSANGSKAASFETTPTFDFDLIPEMDAAPSTQASQAAQDNDFDLQFTELSFEVDAIESSGPLFATPPVAQAPVGDGLNAFGELSLAADDEPMQRPAPPRADSVRHDLSALEARISGLSLVEIESQNDASAAAEDALPSSFTSPLQAPEQTPPPIPPQMPAVADVVHSHAQVPAPSAPAPSAIPNVDARGIVLIEAGLGGPDPVRQVLAGLPPTFPMPVLVRLHLQGGRYDRLVTQMERAASLPVMLAEVGDMVRSGCIYFLPEGVGLHALSYGLEFIAHPSPTTTIFAALPAEESAVLFLSGSDATLIEDAMQAAEAGALVAAQSPGDCYDGAACADLSSRGAVSGLPPELARRLVSRWAS